MCIMFTLLTNVCYGRTIKYAKKNKNLLEKIENIQIVY